MTAAKAPDTSLETTPVAYYGANWNRSQINIDALAKMQMVVLMQEDGHCWETCCPNRFEAGSQCGWKPGEPDATTYKGCDASCEEHGSQEDVFKRVAASAKAQGVRGPHNVLYMNSVYLWPFDAASALGTDAMVNLTFTQYPCLPSLSPSPSHYQPLTFHPRLASSSPLHGHILFSLIQLPFSVTIGH